MTTFALSSSSLRSDVGAGRYRALYQSPPSVESGFLRRWSTRPAPRQPPTYGGGAVMNSLSESVLCPRSVLSRQSAKARCRASCSQSCMRSCGRLRIGNCAVEGLRFHWGRRRCCTRRISICRRAETDGGSRSGAQGFTSTGDISPPEWRRDRGSYTDGQNNRRRLASNKPLPRPDARPGT
jgi:hypothetical protein